MEQEIDSLFDVKKLSKSSQRKYKVNSIDFPSNLASISSNCSL